MRIFIYGTGSGSIKFYNSLRKDKVEVLGFLDSKKAKEGSNFLNNIIFHPGTIKKSDFDYIVIASQYTEIYDLLLSLGFDNSKILQAYNYQEIIDKILNRQNILSNISDNLFEKHILIRKMAYEKDDYLENEFEDKYDYARYKTLQLVADEVYANNIQGAVAEVGVYKGGFAKIINMCFKDRSLYLFDTFEGFDEIEKTYDIENRFSDEEVFEKWDFKDTSVDIVLSKMKYREKCIVKKGYFPDTATDINEKFAFVSIDVDLFEPIYNALDFFYPRINDGGYIFIHDYNNDVFLGVKKAVDKFENKYGKLKKVPVFDHGGTIIIVK